MELFMLIGCGLIGWLAGSVINLFADQLPADEISLARPKCVNCEQTTSIAGYLILAKCPHCHTQRPRIWFVQLVYPLIAMLIWIFPHDRLPFLAGLILLTYMGLVAVIDLEHHLVLGPLSLAGLLIGAVCGIFLHGWQPTLIGGLAGFLIMYAIYWLGRGFSAWMSKRNQQPIEKEAMGFGDVYISAIIGLVLGWPGITAGLILGILLGGLISGIYLLGMVILKRYQYFMAIPYAPFLIVSTVVLIFMPK